jgi:hypothetical protein
MSRKSIPMDYTEEEAQRRLVAALRGARIAGHKPMAKKAASPKRKAKKSQAK